MKSIWSERGIFSLSNKCKHYVSDIFNHGKIDRCLTASRMSAHRPCRGHDAITVATPAVRRALRWPRSTIASGTGDAVMIDSTQCTMHTWCTHVSTHVYHVCTMSHGTHMVHTMWCTPCVHHVHTHGVPSGLIPWYLGTCPKQFLYEIFRWPLTWPRYRSKVRTRLNPYSFLVLKKTWWYSVERVSMSRPKKVSFWLSDVTYFN